ncbi:MAG: DUF1003 domain-containing protein [Rhodospirillaceae bacterium]|nr:MAG: DUF1003 domain-containing protein [Rhodospirillaceae bacterium]
MSEIAALHDPNVPNVLSATDLSLLQQLRVERINREPTAAKPLYPGERVADWIAATVGSWRFILIQSAILLIWLGLNIAAWQGRWDPYPFILLNLVLSFQAAYTAPIIMMSQNRQAAIDRQTQANDYDVNQKAELEIELLHQKIDLLRGQEIVRLIQIIDELAQRLPPGQLRT